MSLFRKRRAADPIETILVEHRAAPAEEFSRSLLARIGSEPSPRATPRLRSVRGRIAVASGLTALALVGATAAAGGVGAASHGVAKLTNVSSVLGLHTTAPVTQANSAKADDESDSNDGPGASQYAVTICHATGSKTNPFVVLTLSPQGAAAHLLHHPGDVLFTGSCPGAKHHP